MAPSIVRRSIAVALCAIALSSVSACKRGGGDGDRPDPSNGEADTKSTADPDECDPTAVAREKVGSNESVVDGTVDIQKDAGVFSGTIDAKAGGLQKAPDNSFLYVDLDEGKRLEISDAEAFENEQWDLAFKRTQIRLNSADSGPGAWSLLDVDQSWEDLRDPPGRDADWQRDDFVAEDCSVKTFGRGWPETAFGSWYDYESSTHAISAPDNAVWALYRSSSHTVLKFEFQSYDRATYQVRWTEL